MSIISSRSAKSRQGFTPYQSEESDLREISLFSRLNLNDNVELDQVLPHLSCNKSASDLLSVSSKKRKLSEELINSSKAGNKTYLNRSLVGKSSLNGGELLIEIDSNYHSKKDLSENSCPVILNGDEHLELFSEPEMPVETRPRFAKTKNLLRNLSNYMHKFILYNPRAHAIIRHYFTNKTRAQARKLSTEKSLSIERDDSVSVKEEPEEKSMRYLEGEAEEVGEAGEGVEVEKQKEKGQGEEAEEVREQMGEFFAWVGELSVGNFSDYENIWTRAHKFRGLYRVICYKYYRNEAYCDIMRSRLTTKEISVQYLVQFIEGMLQPAQFYRFK